MNSGFIQSSLIRFRGFSAQFVIQDNSYNTKFVVSTSGSMSYFNTGGNVGINTTTDAGYRLDVNGITKTQGLALGTVGHQLVSSNEICGRSALAISVKNSGGVLENQLYMTGTTTSAPTALFGIGLSGTPIARLQVRGSGTTSATTSFLVQNSSSTALMQLNDNGNVLINTTTDAGYKLDVNGTARVSGTINVTQVSGDVFRLTNGTYFHSTLGGVQTIDYYNGFVFQNAGQVNIKASFAGNIRFLRDSIFGTDGANNISAQLQIDSTTKGFLPPRMTTTQRNAIASPAAGLVVYDNTDNKHYGYNGTTWNAFY